MAIGGRGPIDGRLKAMRVGGGWVGSEGGWAVTSLCSHVTPVSQSGQTASITKQFSPCMTCSRTPTHFMLL